MQMALKMLQIFIIIMVISLNIIIEVERLLVVHLRSMVNVILYLVPLYLSIRSKILKKTFCPAFRDFIKNKEQQMEDIGIFK